VSKIAIWLLATAAVIMLVNLIICINIICLMMFDIIPFAAPPKEVITLFVLAYAMAAIAGIIQAVHYFRNKSA